MHQTTIRFAPEIWRDLEREARALGISAAQYVRDATAAQLAFAAGRRGALAELDGRGELDGRAELDGRPPARASAALARSESLDALDDAEAVRAQAQLARDRARSTREAAKVAQARRRPNGIKAGMRPGAPELWRGT